MKRRGSGILLHITSLPSPFGIGDLGPWAYRFADFLFKTGQSFWQVLPLNPTDPIHGNSPYSSLSAFAGNPLLISPESLASEGFLSRSDLKGSPSLPEKIDYQAVMKYKENLFSLAYQNFKEKEERDCEFDSFCRDHANWLEDHALFVALKDHLGSVGWNKWPPGVRDRRTKAIDEIRKRLKERAEMEKFVQYLFFKQWFGLNVLKEKNYSWWVKRIAHNLKLFDRIRLDHFQGFANYWEVSSGEPTAVNGRWTKGPGSDFFDTLLKYFPHLPFVAEDLGVITAEVRELRDRYELPGMRVLQFAFGNDPLADEYKPTHYIKNCVAYTGTHDNDTLMGWLFGDRDYSTRNPAEVQNERKNALRYLGNKAKKRKDLHWEFIRLLMMSAANLVIIPMQDLLGLGGKARMNRPGRTRGNWEWRFRPDQLTSSLRKKLVEVTKIYGRT